MKKFALIIPFLQLIGLLIIPMPAVSARPVLIAKLDSSLTAEIRRQLNTGETMPALYYPASVKRFYNQVYFQPAWIKPQNGEGQTWQAVLLLDCVLQYGLSTDDYHPDVLTYKKLHDIMDTPRKIGIREQVRFEIMLTDAVITLMNHLHYGKLNPLFTATKIDEGIKNGFSAETTLRLAIQHSNGYDFLKAIANAQPKSKAYRDMQYHMMLLTGLYTGDNYEFPESDVRIMAINLERLRWTDIEDSNSIQINIPSYTLKFYQADTTYQFKTAVGKPGDPTPTFTSVLNYFTTAPDVRILQTLFRNTVLPQTLADSAYLGNNHLAIYDINGKYMVTDKITLAQIAQNTGGYYARHASGCDKALGNLVFHLPNRFDIDLHDMPKKGAFDPEDRPLSSGCIWVDRAAQLAGLLLTGEGRQNEIKKLHKAISSYKRETFLLNKPVPVKVTYLTCEVKEGKLIIYKDVYHMDKSLEMALYPANENLSMYKPFNRIP